MFTKFLRHIALIALVTTGHTSLPAETQPPAAAAVKVTPLTAGLKELSGNNPAYPPELYAAGISGQVKLALEINSSGAATMARVLESTDPQLEVPAVKAVLRMKFKSRSSRGEILLDFQSPNSRSGVQTQTPALNQTLTNLGYFSGDYILFAEADLKPVVRGQLAAPKFPKMEGQKQNRGSVDIAFIIDTSGVPTQIRVLKATNEYFAKASMEAVAQWRFKPGKKNGKPVACFTSQNMDFMSD